MIQYVLMFNTTAVPAKHKNGCKLVVNVSLSFTDFDFSFSIILSLEYSRGHTVHFWNRLSTVTLIVIFLTRYIAYQKHFSQSMETIF